MNERQNGDGYRDVHQHHGRDDGHENEPDFFQRRKCLFACTILAAQDQEEPS